LGGNGAARMSTHVTVADAEMVLGIAGDDGGDIVARSPGALFWRRLRQDRVAVASLIFVILVIVVAIAAPLVVKLFGLPGPYVQNTNLTNAFGEPFGPRAGHPFGVDSLGEDIASRVIYGSRVSLEVGIIGTGIATVIGIVIGMLAGFYRGWVDSVLSRFTDLVLCFPTLLFGISLASACAVNGCLGGTIHPGLSVIIVIVAIFGWTYIARIVRGLVLSLREKEFVEASRSLGASNARIMFREILPNLIAPVIVYASLLIPINILFEAALSFLGVGVQSPTASWGQMIAQGSQVVTVAWWWMVFPGIALLLTVLAFNLLGDGLQDALNPKGE